MWALIAIACVVAAGVLAVVVLATNNDEDDTTPTAADPATSTTSDASPTPSRTREPKGSATSPTVAPDPEVAYAVKMRRRGWTPTPSGLWVKWDGDPVADRFIVTWMLRVVSREGCPNGVYVAANIMDTANTVIGFTNDILPSLPAEQEAVLKLPSTEDGRLRIQITETNCH